MQLNPISVTNGYEQHFRKETLNCSSLPVTLDFWQLSLICCR